MLLCDPLDVEAPIVAFAAEQLSRMLTDPTDIAGTVSDVNLDEWRLEIAHFDLGRFTTLANGDSAVLDGTLARLDPGALANGIYQLRLTATDSELSGSDEVTVSVAAAIPPNSAPVVSVGPDRAVQLPGQLSLSRRV